MKPEARCDAIELILSDVDGVLTDGGVIFDNEGIEVKRFHIRDGLGIKLWQRAGYRFGLVTARSSHIVKVRAAELGIDIIRQGSEQKLPNIKEIMTQLNLRPDQVCYIGDDLTDLAAIQTVGLGVAVADAALDVRSSAHFITKLSGGHGAVRSDRIHFEVEETLGGFDSEVPGVNAPSGERLELQDHGGPVTARKQDAT